MGVEHIWEKLILHIDILCQEIYFHPPLITERSTKENFLEHKVSKPGQIKIAHTLSKLGGSNISLSDRTNSHQKDKSISGKEKVAIKFNLRPIPIKLMILYHTAIKAMNRTHKFLMLSFLSIRTLIQFLFANTV